MDEKDENDKEKEMNNNIISNNTRNIKKIHYNNNFGLTKEQFELMKKIREEAITRTERYSDLISSNKSNDELIDTHKNKKKKINLIKSDTNSKSEKINLDNNSLGIGDIEDKNDDKIIDPNKERIFKKSQAFIFYKGEPIIIIGPDSQYYVWIFSFVSFFCIILYSLKNTFMILKIGFSLSYLFFAITYTLLLVLNPGIPINKKDYDITKLQGNYRQCPECNCISKDEIGRYTVHCEICKICVEYFDHHCAFTTKCIGKNNRIIFKMFLISIPLLFLVSFLYLIF
jgi:hypothetical protein